MKKLLFLAIALLFAGRVAAKIELPEIFSAGMVLQQNTTVRLWGWATPGAAVRIATSWGEKAATTAASDGRWTASVTTPGGSYEPRSITFTSGDQLTLNNVLIGEVWFAGGQSNMEMPLGGFGNCPTEGANEIVARAGALRQRIRYVKIPHRPASEPQDRVSGRWCEFSPATAPKMTATGYFFAELLNAALDVPVGIVDCTWGGSRVESWTRREILETYPDIDLSAEGIRSMADYLRPLLMYNGMLHPVAGYTVRGFIWYQGESNVWRYMDYAERLATMVAQWRTEWGQGELPFYYAEIAPYQYSDHDRGAYLREAQFRAQALIPHSGMISTNDLVEDYEQNNVHPKNKRDVGRRLAFMALNRTYDMPTVACQSPSFRSMEVRGNEVVVALNDAEEGFNRLKDIEGFEVCGADSVFHPAQVRVDEWKRQLVVSSSEVAAPVHVRYCFANYRPGNLGNVRGLPLIPFRTDDFPPRR